MLLVPELPYVYMRALTLGASWEVLKSSVSNTSMDGVTNNSKKTIARFANSNHNDRPPLRRELRRRSVTIILRRCLRLRLQVCASNRLRLQLRRSRN